MKIPNNKENNPCRVSKIKDETEIVLMGCRKCLKGEELSVKFFFLIAVLCAFGHLMHL